MRLIDADALVVRLKDWQGDKEDVDMSDPHDVGYYAAMGRAVRLTSLAPSLDAVPVVRCKDCRNYNPVLQECWYFQAIMAPVDYCSEGVRKDDEAHD